MRVALHLEMVAHHGHYALYLTRAERGEASMVRVTLRLPDDLHEKLRWVAYRERTSQQALVLEALREQLKSVSVPKQRDDS